MLVNNLSIVKDITILVRFEFPSDHRICRALIQIPKRAKYKNYQKDRRGGKWMVPVSRRNEAEKWILEKLKRLAPNKHNYDI